MVGLDVGVDEFKLICGRPATEPRIDVLSEAAGEKADPGFFGELECEEGVGLFLGDVAAAGAGWTCIEGGRERPGSALGAMEELDRRDC